MILFQELELSNIRSSESSSLPAFTDAPKYRRRGCDKVYGLIIAPSECRFGRKSNQQRYLPKMECLGIDP